jgi:UDP-N-acetylmuramoyl-tripeptide--D-alanyl-D-alanine ligase
MKKMKLTINDLFNIPTAEIFNPDSFSPLFSVSIDTRTIKKNSLFVAIKGNKFDGHDFVRNALKEGAAAVVINKRNFGRFGDLEIPVITVTDTTKALGYIAKSWRNKLNAKIISITGSAGKTSTKEILAALLNERFNVNKTMGNNNNHIGVPLTILSTNEKHEILILEQGTNHFGEIEYTAGIAQPDYALITNIGNSHLEFLKNKSGVLREKLALFNAATARDGVIFINNDDELLKKSVRGYHKRITYGFKKADVTGRILNYTVEGKTNLEINFGKRKLSGVLPLYGEQNAKNFLAASTVAFKLGLTNNQITAGLKKLKAADKRINVKRFEKFVLIDDTYNANPDSMKFAIELMTKISNKRRIALLGDMFELGKSEIKLHKALAPIIRKAKIDEVYTIGKRMGYLHEVLRGEKFKSKHFKKRSSLLGFIQEYDFSDSVILVKGSHGMKMEEFVNTLAAKSNK